MAESIKGTSSSAIPSGEAGYIEDIDAARQMADYEYPAHVALAATHDPNFNQSQLRQGLHEARRDLSERMGKGSGPGSIERLGPVIQSWLEHDIAVRTLEVPISLEMHLGYIAAQRAEEGLRDYNEGIDRTSEVQAEDTHFLLIANGSPIES